ncbi:MAG: endonuclease/exonuclease/phosphatase family protein [Verrucomicrobiota bacterium]
MRLFVCFVGLLAVSCSWGEAAGSIRIATYNVQNYLITDRWFDGAWRPEYPKPESEKARVREAILEVRPDVLLLQEMGPPPFLEELRADLAEAGLDYAHAVHFRAVDEERHLAVLSMLPFAEVVKHRDLDFKYLDRRALVKRGFLELRLEDPAGADFQLFTLHLKSRWTDDAADPESALRRTREAEACRNRLVERTFESGRDRFLVAGDFNDHPVSAPLRRFYERGELEIARRLPAVDGKGESWTYFYRKQLSYTTVDAFVVSDALRPAVREGRASVHGGADVLEGSDHRMVFVDLAWPLAAVSGSGD